MVPYRETVTRRAVGERKYVRYFDGRGHFAHLRLELIPRPGQLPSITAAEDLTLSADCRHAARSMLFKKMDRGPIHGFPLIGLELRLLAATHLAPYSHPEAFAAVASMAFDEAMILAAPIVVEPWVGLRLRVEDYALSATFDILTRFLGTVRAELSLGEYFILDIQIPARLKSNITSALGLARPETRPLEETERYKPLTGPLDHLASQDGLGDWT
jgi:elongation factor G